MTPSMSAEQALREWWKTHPSSAKSNRERLIWLAAFTQGATQERKENARLAYLVQVPNQECSYELALRDAIATAIRQRSLTP